MEFGHVYDLEDIDFNLPTDGAFTKKVLLGTDTGSELQVYVGASKWGEKTWLGKLYPKKTPDSEFLKVYCQNFNTVEFGPTFYNIYSATELNRWVSQVSDTPGFKFFPKFPQTITHIRRLKNAEDASAKFYESLTGFGNHLGPLLLQVGDNFTPKNFPQLKAYLESLPRTIKVTVEVRNKEWFANENDRHNLFQLLYDLNIGTVIVDSAGRRDCVHMDITTEEATVRFVGNNDVASDYQRLDSWVERVQMWRENGLKTIWFFIHQYHEWDAPETCDYLIQKLNEKLGTNIARPHFLDK